MKRIFTIVAMTLLWIASLSAQVPQKLTYQAVIRDAVGNVITNQDLAVQVSILQGSIEGPVIYSENHTTSTTVNGVITLEVGGGKTSYDFTSIDWSDGPFYIRSTAELNGKSISVTSQLLSVPYALYAQRSFIANKVDEQFMEDVITAKIQSALEEQNAAWENKMQIAMDERDATWEDKIRKAMNEMDTIWRGKLQSALRDRDALWEEKFKALEAVLDSISAQQATPVDTIPSDTIPTGITDTIPTDTVPTDTVYKSAAKNGVLPGKFSIKEGVQVHFSRGIMQYHNTKKEWRFAKDQLDILGKSYMDYCQYPPKAWVDHFEFGTINGMECPFYAWYYDPYYGYRIDYDRDAVKEVDQWIILKYDGWEYLLYERNNADKLYSKAEVGGMKGFVFLPDDWTTPSDLAFTPKAEDYTINVYDKKTWSRMEALGAVFMPCDQYWSWGLLCTLLDLRVDHAYPTPNGNYYKNSFISESESSGRSKCAYRLVIPDSTAIKIMGEETTEETSTEGEMTLEEINNYYPDEPGDLSNVDMKAGLLNGKFSVSETKQVNFSQGNLQYNKNTKIWRFAEAQYEYIQNPEWWGSSRTITEDGWFDSFSWASSGYAFDPVQHFEYSSSYAHCLGNSDAAGTKFDWGVNNAISNGGNTPNIWRTLTKEEWEYLMNRKIGRTSLCAPATVCGKEGIVLLPDNWNFDSDLPYTDQPDMEKFASYGADVNYGSNVYSKELWTRMEAQGAVFLPSAGMVLTDHFWDVDDTGMSSWTEGSYWSISHETNDGGQAMYIYMECMAATYEHHNRDLCSVYYNVGDFARKFGCSVRLVRDVTE